MGKRGSLPERTQMNVDSLPMNIIFFSHLGYSMAINSKAKGLLTTRLFLATLFALASVLQLPAHNAVLTGAIGAEEQQP
jgi:hypothetical protein